MSRVQKQSDLPRNKRVQSFKIKFMNLNIYRRQNSNDKICQSLDGSDPPDRLSCLSDGEQSQEMDNTKAVGPRRHLRFVTPIRPIKSLFGEGKSFVGNLDDI